MYNVYKRVIYIMYKISCLILFDIYDFYVT